MGFASYAAYKRCFDWAYGTRALRASDCRIFLEGGSRMIFRTSEGELLCVKSD